jgi:hypothetical protein
MSTVDFSVPEDVKQALNAAFEGQSKSAVIADLMREAVARVQRRRVHAAAVERILAEVAAALARLKPEAAPKHVADLADLDIGWTGPTDALAGAVDLAARLDQHVLGALHHALALTTPAAVLVTADPRYYEKARMSGQISWLPEFRIPLSRA